MKKHESIGPPLLVAVISLVLLVFVQERVEEARLEATGRSLVGATVDPETFFSTILLAGFRAIAIDIAWIRADYFERAGDLWAVKPTLELITDLQPTTEVVWNHIAWHLAFNMSLEEREDDLEARWKWIDSAIKTLERGLERNPRSYLIRQELGAWVIYNKCVDTDLDEGAPYFAKRFAETRGRPPLDVAIELLEAARAIPEHVDAVVPLCPKLFHALLVRFDAEVESYLRAPGESAWEKLDATRQQLIAHREHMIEGHERTRSLILENYLIPELPPR